MSVLSTLHWHTDRHFGPNNPSEQARVEQSGPVQPCVQVQAPFTGSHVAPFMHVQLYEQFAPYFPSAHDCKHCEHTTIISTHIYIQ